MKSLALCATGLGLVLVLGGCANNSDNSAGGTASATATPEATLDLSKYAALPPVPAPAAPTVDCTYPAGAGSAKAVSAPPTTGVPAEGTVAVHLATTAGPIGLTLDRAAAPCTVNSFVSLTQQGYFNDTPCHRLVTEVGLEVLQCGDPSGRGSGGPGYTFANEYPTNQYPAGDRAAQAPAVYPRGTVAMANAGPDTNGSQFFLVYADSVLAPQYTVFGTISEEGLATLEKVAAAGDDGSIPAGGGKPKTPVQIQTATVA